MSTSGFSTSMSLGGLTGMDVGRQALHEGEGLPGVADSSTGDRDVPRTGDAHRGIRRRLWGRDALSRLAIARTRRGCLNLGVDQACDSSGLLLSLSLNRTRRIEICVSGIIAGEHGDQAVVDVSPCAGLVLSMSGPESW